MPGVFLLANAVGFAYGLPLTHDGTRTLIVGLANAPALAIVVAVPLLGLALFTSASEVRNAVLFLSAFYVAGASLFCEAFISFASRRLRRFSPQASRTDTCSSERCLTS